MGYIVVIEAAEHMYYGVGLADIGKEFIAQTLALGGAFHQTGDIHDLDSGRNHRPGVAHLDELGKTVVGHRNDAHIGLYGAERKIGRLGLGIGETVKKCRLAHIGQSHNSTLQ